MAARRERGLLDSEAAPGASPFDHHVYVIASDGDLMEGVTAEASSLAGHQQLGNLVVFYDANHISIEDEYVEDVDALHAAIAAAKADTGRPSLIKLRTVIGWPAQKLQNSGKAHGAALGADEIAATKRLLGFDPDAAFTVEDEVLAHAREAVMRGTHVHQEWLPGFETWRTAHPDRAALLDRLLKRQVPDGWAAALPSFAPDA